MHLKNLAPSSSFGIWVSWVRTITLPLKIHCQCYNGIHCADETHVCIASTHTHTPNIATSNSKTNQSDEENCWNLRSPDAINLNGICINAKYKNLLNFNDIIYFSIENVSDAILQYIYCRWVAAAIRNTEISLHESIYSLST